MRLIEFTAIQPLKSASWLIERSEATPLAILYASPADRAFLVVLDADKFWLAKGGEKATAGAVDYALPRVGFNGQLCSTLIATLRTVLHG